MHSGLLGLGEAVLHRFRTFIVFNYINMILCLKHAISPKLSSIAMSYKFKKHH